MEPVQPGTESAMTTKEHPILFSGPLIRAILSGKKTQTRRLLRWDGVQRAEPCPVGPAVNWSLTSYGGSLRVVRCPYGQPGDRLWVRETWTRIGNDPGADHYRASASPADLEWITGQGVRWTPSIHMPRRASRISLEVIEVRVQRIQDITEEDARAEGIHEHPLGRAALDANGTHKGAFLAVWEAINGARPGGSIGENPWVWAVSFKRVQA